MNIAEMGGSPALPVIDALPQPVVDVVEVAPPPVRVGRVARWTAVAAAVLSVSGCFGGHGKPAPEQVTPVNDGAAGVEALEGNAMYAFEQDVLGNTPNIDDAKKQAVIVGRDNPSVMAQLNKIMDAAAASKAVGGSYGHSSDSVADVLGLTKGIQDPALQAQANTTLYVLKAKDTVDVLGGFSDAKDLDEARGKLKAPDGSGLNGVEAHADAAADAKFAGSQVTSYSSYTKAEVKANLDKVQNSCVRADSLLALDKKDASAALLSAASGDPVDIAAARAVIDGISDAATKAEAARALNKYAANDYDGGEDIRYKIDDQERKLQDALDDTCAVDFQRDVKAAQGFDDEMSGVIGEGVDQVEADLNNQFAQNAGLHPTVVTELPQDTEPSAVINMTGVTGKQKIHNDAYAKDQSVDDGEKQPETYNQFGEIYAQDGQLVFKIRDDANLSAETRQRLQKAFELDRPFLEASFAAGQLVSVHFVTGESFEPFYYTPSRETYMVMPTDDRMSQDELTMGLRHETIHSLVREMYRGLSGTNDQLDRLNHACNSLIKTAYDDFQLTLETQPELLANLRAAAKPEHKPIIDAMIKAVKDGHLSEITTDPRNQLPNASSNQCKDADSSAVILRSAKEKAGVETKDGDLGYLIESDAYTAFNKEWSSFMDYLSIYRNFIDESAYVVTNNPDKRLYGHGEQDANEATTSILDAVITYRGKFHDGFIKLEPDEQAAVREMLGVAAEFAAENHPSLAPYFAKASKI